MARTKTSNRGPSMGDVAGAAEQAEKAVTITLAGALTECVARSSVVHSSGIGLAASTAVACIIGNVFEKRKVADILDDVQKAVTLKGYKKSQVYKFCGVGRKLALKLVSEFKMSGPIATIASAKTAAEATEHVIAHLKTLVTKTRENGIDTLDALDKYVTAPARRETAEQTAAKEALKAANDAAKAKPVTMTRATDLAAKLIASDTRPENIPSEMSTVQVFSAVESAMSSWDIPVLVKAMRHGKQPFGKLIAEMFTAIDSADELSEILKAGHVRLQEMQAQIAEAKNAPAQASDARAEGRAN